MLEQLKKAANVTYTENGAVTNESTMSYCLDLFAAVGAMRTADEKDILDRFVRAYAEDPDAAMRILFFARDVRGGLGERRVFRIICSWLAANKKSSLEKNLRLIPEYGRWDDVVALLNTDCRSEAVNIISEQLEKDMQSDSQISLLAKWLPSVNASSAQTVKTARSLAKALCMTEAQYRRTLSALRKKLRIIENDLRERDYSFDYSAQPSKAMFKYRKAFIRNDGERYIKFLRAVMRGEKKLHADTLAPYELIKDAMIFFKYNQCAVFPEEEKAALNASWGSLPDYCDGRNALAVVDTSGSMYSFDNCRPASVALSLGLYFAERSKGIFRNHFIEFSRRPQLIELKGESFTDKLEYICSFNEVANTDLEAVFDLILTAAVQSNVPQEELPETLYIISDMEFDCCVENASLSNFENAKRKFAMHGYKLPQIIFWNVASRNRNVPVTQNEQGVALVSGCTPRLFSLVASGEVTPFSAMQDIINSKRYADICA